MARQELPPDNIAGWDALADAYQQHVGWPHDELSWGLRCPPEAELGLVADVAPGAATVVLGCGGGQDLVAMAALGAGPLVGVDPSQRQLEHAQRLLDAEGLTARLVPAPAERLPEITDDTCDLVVSVQALNYVEDIAACVAEVRRILRPGGVFAFSVLHPADMSTDDSAPHGWHTSWFQIERDWVWDGMADEDVPLRSWFRSASDWFTALTSGGLVVERLLEPAPTDDARWIERGWLDDITYAKLERVPGSILVRARKSDAANTA